MLIFIKIINESIRQAFHSLASNKLRTFLSLIGITIGIFTIVAVRSAVDSLQRNLEEGISEMGSDVIYVVKFPWTSTTEDNYWKFLKRPEPSLDDYKVIKEKSDLTSMTSFLIDYPANSIIYRSNSVGGAQILATTHEYQDIQNLVFAQGRYFTQQESNNGSNKIILGHVIARELFPNIEPLGKEIKLKGKKYKVIGVLKEEGESMTNFINFDEVVWIPLNSARKFINIKDRGVDRGLLVKKKEGVELADLKSEITGILRSKHKLKPKEEDDFSLMEMSAVIQSMESFFSVLNIVGIVIGGFALLVGMISVANIMFVSVRERTSQIGIKMAIGAKRHMILLEFLTEGVMLCIIGGIMGLIFVYGMTSLISGATSFAMGLSFGNVLYGVAWSLAVGIIAAIIPACLASKMHPVVAIRK